mmetsp:Transcript_66279/g.194391  ORF Transcript_66279/g.194391 Transcript_66279/m.194391 type:complete len:444 (-) Transcript_66279:73-1404(-)
MLAKKEDGDASAYSRLTTDETVADEEVGPSAISPSRNGTQSGVSVDRTPRAASCSPVRSAFSTPRFTSVPAATPSRGADGKTPMRSPLGSQGGDSRTPLFHGGSQASLHRSVSPPPTGGRMAASLSGSPMRSPARNGGREDSAPTLLTRSKDGEAKEAAGEGIVESPHSSLATPSRPLLSFMSAFSHGSDNREATFGSDAGSAPTPPAGSTRLLTRVMETKAPVSTRVRREILVARHSPGHLAPILITGEDVPEPSPRSPNGSTFTQKLGVFVRTPKLAIAAGLALVALLALGIWSVTLMGSRQGQSLRHGGSGKAPGGTTDERPPSDMCTTGDQTLLMTLQGSSKHELFAKAAECGHQTLRLGWSIYFDHDGFLKCMSDYRSDISSRCYECFLWGATWTAANCKAACMMSWCSTECLACVKGNEEQESQCTGLSSPLTPEPC